MSLLKTKPSTGTLLVSDPFLKDTYFNRSVVLLAEHNENGTFGLIINKPIEVKLKEVLTDFPDFDATLFIGGPLKTDNLFMLHNKGEQIENSSKIMNGLYWGGNIDTIKSMIDDKKMTPLDIRFYIGYSGWDANQLNKELSENAWIIAKAKPNEFLIKTPEILWKNLVTSLGSEYALWANYPIEPIMN